MTLLELVTCLAISAVLVGGLASSVFLATKGLETLTSATNGVLDSGAALNQLTADVRMATGFTERTSTAITFTVPDRTGDGWPDAIRYAWAGAGSPLTRTVNGLPNPAATILENVSALELTYLTRTMQPSIVESAEQLLVSYLPAVHTTSTAISRNMWGAQYFKPTLPANAISWKITRIRLLFKKGTLVANVTVPVTMADAAQKPTTPSLDSYTVSSSTFNASSLGWVEFPYTNLAMLDPALGYSFHVETLPSGTSTVAYVGFNNSVSPGLTYGSNCYSTNQGGSWTAPLATKAIFFEVYGTVTTQGF